MSAQGFAAGPGVPVYSLSISWINLRSAGGKWLMLALEPVSGGAGAGHLGDECGWPRWALNGGRIKADSPWVAMLDAGARGLVSVVRPAPDEQGVERLLHCDPPAALPPELWAMVEEQQRVLLCGPVYGRPTVESLQAAERAGTLCAIAAPVMLT